MPDWVIYALLTLASAAISIIFIPRPKAQGPKAQVLETPTVDAGRPVPVVFGRIRVKSPNLLYMGGRFTSEVKRRA